MASGGLETISLIRRGGGTLIRKTAQYDVWELEGKRFRITTGKHGRDFESTRKTVKHILLRMEMLKRQRDLHDQIDQGLPVALPSTVIHIPEPPTDETDDMEQRQRINAMARAKYAIQLMEKEPHRIWKMTELVEKMPKYLIETGAHAAVKALLENLPKFDQIEVFRRAGSFSSVRLKPAHQPADHRVIEAKEPDPVPRVGSDLEVPPEDVQLFNITDPLAGRVQDTSRTDMGLPLDLAQELQALIQMEPGTIQAGIMLGRLWQWHLQCSSGDKT